MKRCLLPLLLLTIVLSLSVRSAVATLGRWNGWITDEHCGAKGAKASHQACAEKCVQEGSKLIFYNDADKKLYKLDNQELAKEHLGHAVTVTGDCTGDLIKVSSIAKQVLSTRN